MNCCAWYLLLLYYQNMFVLCVVTLDVCYDDFACMRTTCCTALICYCHLHMIIGSCIWVFMLLRMFACTTFAVFVVWVTDSYLVSHDLLIVSTCLIHTTLCVCEMFVFLVCVLVRTFEPFPRYQLVCWLTISLVRTRLDDGTVLCDTICFCECV